MTETASGFGMAITLTGLRDMLRMRLNCVDMGSYSTTEMDYYLNLAYRETHVKARCHKVTEVVTLVPSQTDYTLANVFEPVEVNLAGVILKRRELGGMGVSLSAWASAAADTPTDWMQMSGATIRLYPKPSTAGALTVHGYGFAAALTTNDAVPTAVPPAFAVSAILDRAEAEARKARLSYANNSAIAERLMAQWNGWVEEIQKCMGGK